METSLFYPEPASEGLKSVLTLTYKIYDYALTHYCCTFFVIYCCCCRYLSLFLSGGGFWVVLLTITDIDSSHSAVHSKISSKFY